MGASTLSSKGQLVIPAQMRKALDLRPGDRIDIRLQGRKLVLQRESPRSPRLRRGRFGRPVLTSPPGAPAITTESVNAILEELP